MPKLTNLDVEWVSLVDRAAVRDPANKSEPQRFLIWKRDGETTPEGGEMTEAEMRAAVEKAEQERNQAQEALKKAESDHAELTARVAELEKAATPEEKPAEINKAELPEPVRIALEKAETERAAMAERLEKAETVAKTERDERLTRDFIAKAETLKALPVNASEFGPVLKAASEGLTSEQFTALETVLKAADEQIAKGELFKEQGRAGDPAKKSGTALAEATQKAEEIRKSDPTVSKAFALDRVLRSDRALQDRYLAEVRG